VHSKKIRAINKSINHVSYCLCVQYVLSHSSPACKRQACLFLSFFLSCGSGRRSRKAACPWLQVLHAMVRPGLGDLAGWWYASCEVSGVCLVGYPLWDCLVVGFGNWLGLQCLQSGMDLTEGLVHYWQVPHVLVCWELEIGL
jgi:hypothetical protein